MPVNKGTGETYTKDTITPVNRAAKKAMMLDAKAIIGLFAIGLLAGCIKGETTEEKDAGRRGRMECSDPQIIPEPSSDTPAVTPDPPC